MSPTTGSRAVHEHTWPGLEKAAVKGLGNLTGLAKAVGLSKKHQDKHNTFKSPHGSKLYRLSLKNHRSSLVISTAKEGLFEALKDWSAWSNSVTFILTKQADAKQSTAARSSTLRLGDSPIAGALFKLQTLNGSEGSGGYRTARSSYKKDNPQNKLERGGR